MGFEKGSLVKQTTKFCLLPNCPVPTSAPRGTWREREEAT